MSVLKSNSELSDFAGILVRAGFDTELASGGPYTVIAPTNAQFGTRRDKINAASKAELRKVFGNVLLKGTISDDTTELEDLLGDSHKVTVSGGSIKVKGVAKPLRLVANASNGAIYRAD